MTAKTILIALSMVLLTLASNAAAAKPDRPNVLFIAIDDLNDWIGCLGGYPGVKTPHLDRLAARGMLFTDAHCSAPLCNASRASLMTGIRPSTSGVYFNAQPWRKSPVLKNAVTIPQHFTAAGYRVRGGGKIYHGRFPDPPSWPEYFPSQTKNKPADPMPKQRPISGIPGTGHFDWGPVQVKDEAMGDAKVVQWAAGELAGEYDRPFFLAVGIFRPHLPWYVPKKYFDQYPIDKIVLPKVLKSDLDDVPPPGVKIARPSGDHAKVTRHKQWTRAVQGYLASISFADAMLGRLLDALDKSPHAKNTVIVLWGDHGWHLGEKLHWRKFTLWQEATHMPLMIVAPGITRPGERCRQPVSLLDVYPTLVELAGLPKRDVLEGQSLLAQLKDPAAPRERPVINTFGRNNHAVIASDYRYIRYADGSEELYDRGEDELEWTNLAKDAKHLATKKKLADWLPKLNRQATANK